MSQIALRATLVLWVLVSCGTVDGSLVQRATQPAEGNTLVLTFKGREVTDADLKLLKDHPNVEKVSFTFCSGITDEGLKHLKSLSRLSTLQIVNCNKITDAGLQHLKGLKNLTTLALNSDKITGSGLIHLKKLSKLESLDLSYCISLTDAGLKHLAEMKSLTGLNIGSCTKVTDRGLRSLRRLTNLTHLRIWHFRNVTDSVLESLAELTQMKVLDLLCPDITDEGLQHLRNMQHLTALHLGGDKIEGPGLRNLRGKFTIQSGSVVNTVTNAGESLSGGAADNQPPADTLPSANISLSYLLSHPLDLLLLFIDQRPIAGSLRNGEQRQ